ncbi:MAG: hypothetical protein AAF548_14845 [Actinomycetota bacterium]
MTIEKGEEWGRRSVVPADAVVVDSDHAAAEIVAAARRRNEEIPALALRAGDLARTLGGTGRVTTGEEGTELTVDVGAALVDGKLHWFVAHLVARHGWLRGRIVVAANAAFIGAWNIAPRAHPGDGLLDVVDADPPLRDRLAARRRLPSGTHVPHPDIRIRRRDAIQVELDRPTAVHLDGRRIGDARNLSIRIEPEALRVWV